MLQLTTILFLIAGSIWAFIHFVAIELFLYWKFWWFDLPMHFLGGAIVALLLFTLYDLRILVPKSLLKLFKVLFIVLLVAIAWELYEYLIGAPQPADNYALDTAIDIFLGLLGGYVGYAVGSAIRKL